MYAPLDGVSTVIDQDDRQIQPLPEDCAKFLHGHLRTPIADGENGVRNTVGLSLVPCTDGVKFSLD